MNLNRTAGVFSEVADRCPELEGRNFVIMIMDLPHPFETAGYEIVIRTEGRPLKDVTLRTLREITARENLKVEETRNSVMIYEPMPTSHDH